MRCPSVLVIRQMWMVCMSIDTNTELTPVDKVLKPCPFCNNKATLIEKVMNKGSNTSGRISNGAVIVRTRQTGYHYKCTRYDWERKGYVVSCTDNRCVAYNTRPRYLTIDEAVDRWNMRY